MFWKEYFSASNTVKTAIFPHEDDSVTLPGDRVKDVCLRMAHQSSNLDALTSEPFHCLHSTDDTTEARGGQMAHSRSQSK